MYITAISLYTSSYVYLVIRTSFEWNVLSRIIIIIFRREAKMKNTRSYVRLFGALVLNRLSSDRKKIS